MVDHLILDRWNTYGCSVGIGIREGRGGRSDLGGWVIDPAAGGDGDLGGGLEAEFGFDVFAMGLDGFHGEAEFGGDARDGIAIAEAGENFPFARGELFGGGPGIDGRGQRAGKSITDPRASGEDALDGGGQVAERSGFRKESGRTAADGGGAKAAFVESGKDQTPGSGPVGGEGFEQVDDGLAIDPELGNDQADLPQTEEPSGVGEAGAGRDVGVMGDVLEGSDQSPEDHRVRVDEKNGRAEIGHGERTEIGPLPEILDVMIFVTEVGEDFVSGFDHGPPPRRSVRPCRRKRPTCRRFGRASQQLWQGMPRDGKARGPVSPVCGQP